MSRFIPKDIPGDPWVALAPYRAFAIRSNSDEPVYLKFGKGHGLFLSIVPSGGNRLINILDYQTGDQSFVGKISENESVFLGRSADCGLKILHAIISRRHLEMRSEGNILIIRDLGSTNGTSCHSDQKHFDIDQYLADRPLGQAEEMTLDWIHEYFGPTLDDFLRRYSANSIKKDDSNNELNDHGTDPNI